MASQGAVLPSGPATRYAAALYAHAEDLGRLQPVTINMDRMGEMLAASPDLRQVIASPLTDAKSATALLHALVRKYELGVLQRKLIDVLIANHRLSLLPAVIAAFAALVAEKRGIVTAAVTSAHPLTDVQEQQLRARLIELGYGNVRIERSLDPSLLGGLILRVGARLYDTSLKSRLQRLRYAMKDAA